MYKELLTKLYVDFDESMGKGKGYDRVLESLTEKHRKTYNTFKSLYEKNNFLKVTPAETPRIPKIIHQIWIGNRPIPRLCEKYRQTWVQHHPDWEYKFWTDQEIGDYRFANRNLELLFQKSTKIGEKVDILRYDILYQFGGLYVDVDCQCQQPLDVLNHCYDFYAGLLNPIPLNIIESINVCNAVVAAKPGHPVLERLSELLVERWERLDIPEDAIYSTIQRTYTVLTDAVLQTGGQGQNVDIILPATYFYPILPLKALDLLARGWKQVLIDRLNFRPGPFSKIRPHSFIHHDTQREWFYDSYASVTLRSKVWLGFKLKDWLLWTKAKFFGVK